WHTEGMYVFPRGYQSNPVCGVSRYLGQDSGEISANARLIASAPDMLAVLQQVEAEMAAGFGSSFGETREQVRRAIAKATGA
ncbi:hypothetical protein, partial [Mesorhizobium sp. M1A.F.Ca.IN.020.06.1.1]